MQSYFLYVLSFGRKNIFVPFGASLYVYKSFNFNGHKGVELHKNAVNIFLFSISIKMWWTDIQERMVPQSLFPL